VRETGMEYKEVFENWAQGKIESKRAIVLLQNECLECLSKMIDLNDMVNGKLTAQQRFSRMLNPSTFNNELLYESENLRRSSVIITEYIKKCNYSAGKIENRLYFTRISKRS
jgi:hypothetical protein